ncbi:MAG: hypothetical protein JO370_16725 [Paucibacter sp.]|nr:hypothetical protein [Roseateles sp.]
MKKLILTISIAVTVLTVNAQTKKPRVYEHTDTTYLIAAQGKVRHITTADYQFVLKSVKNPFIMPTKVSAQVNNDIADVILAVLENRDRKAILASHE